MSQGVSIKVSIAEREYPLTVNEKELNAVKVAEQEIQQKVKTLMASYKVKDKQDLLAMCLLQMVVEKNQKGQSTQGIDPDLINKLTDLESFVSDYLKSKD